MFGLPFREVWALDFEFIAEPGALPVPVCMVARELHSGRLLRLWQDQLPDRPPFPVDDRALFIAYYASAEIGCFLALGWPVPARLLDLYAEFRNETNGLPWPAGVPCSAPWPTTTSRRLPQTRNTIVRGACQLA